MSSRYYSEFSDKKISSSGGYTFRGAGSTPAMKEKPAFPNAKLPGKASKLRPDWGMRRVKQRPKQIGI